MSYDERDIILAALIADTINANIIAEQEEEEERLRQEDDEEEEERLRQEEDEEEWRKQQEEYYEEMSLREEVEYYERKFKEEKKQEENSKLMKKINFLLISLINKKNINWDVINRFLLNNLNPYDYNDFKRIKSYEDLYSLKMNCASAMNNNGAWRKVKCKTCHKEFYMSKKEVDSLRKAPFPLRCKNCQEKINKNNTTNKIPENATAKIHENVTHKNRNVVLL